MFSFKQKQFGKDPRELEEMKVKLENLYPAAASVFYFVTVSSVFFLQVSFPALLECHVVGKSRLTKFVPSSDIVYHLVR